MTNEEALKKIQKLLALAKSDNPNEAALAAARAQALMDKHRISQASLDVQEEDGPIGEETLTTTSQNWRRTLAKVISDANGCKVWRSDRDLDIAGRPSAVNAVRYLFAYCAKTIDELAQSHKGEGRTFLNNYRHGCVAGIRKAIEEEQARTRQAAYEAAGGTSDLVVIDRALARIDADAKAVDSWVGERHNLRKSSSSSRHNRGARALGERDGATIYPGAGSGVTAGNKRIA